MRIFVFSTVFAPKIGGIELQTELLAREWTELGHEVLVATTTPGPEGGFPFPVIRSGSLTTFLKWARWCDVHLQLNVSLKHTSKAVMAGAPAIVISHGGDYKGRYARVKRLFAGRIKGIACSDYIREQQVPTGVTIRNCYDDATYRSNSVWGERPHDLAFLGRLVSDKGCDTLIEAVGLLGARGLRPTVTIIGDGEHRPTLEAMVSQSGLTNRVRFTGTLAPTVVADVLNQHRFLIVPSRWEGFGIVALEALGCGCVPIVSRCGGLLEAIGPHGYSFDIGDSQELARLIENALKQPDQALAKLQGVDAHLANFTARRVAERYIELFEKLRR